MPSARSIAEQPPGFQFPPLTHCPRPLCGRELTPGERGLTAHVGSCSQCADPKPPHWVNFGREWVRVPAGMSAAEYDRWLDEAEMDAVRGNWDQEETRA